MTHDQHLMLLALAECALQNIRQTISSMYLTEPESPDRYTNSANRDWGDKIKRVVEAHVKNTEVDLLRLQDYIETLKSTIID